MAETDTAFYIEQKPHRAAAETIFKKPSSGLWQHLAERVVVRQQNCFKMV